MQAEIEHKGEASARKTVGDDKFGALAACMGRALGLYITGAAPRRVAEALSGSEDSAAEDRDDSAALGGDQREDEDQNDEVKKKRVSKKGARKKAKRKVSILEAAIERQDPPQILTKSVAVETQTDKGGRGCRDANAGAARR